MFLNVKNNFCSFPDRGMTPISTCMQFSYLLIPSHYVFNDNMIFITADGLMEGNGNGNNFRLTTLHNNSGKQVTSPACKFKIIVTVSRTLARLALHSRLKINRTCNQPLVVQ